ncbi:PREDICTED: PRA1 family protein D-like [Ipomoea nil]|uniref:PRA1 family protein D-like n=1 Tax=Ipomoea nil TaxID=35883 RepID=UPI000901B6B9|nr:PREDICTED: PRA1 family protein D-like [Ipomoea nil]
MSSSPAPSIPAVPLRPWPQFADTAALSIPISFSDATYRINQNLRYFVGNYAVLFFLVLLLSLISRPLTLILFLVISASWIFLYLSRSEALELFGFDIDDRIILGLLSLITLIALFVAGVWSNVFISVAIGVVLACLHAAMRAPEDQEASPYENLLSVVDSPTRGDYARV